MEKIKIRIIKIIIILLGLIALFFVAFPSNRLISDNFKSYNESVLKKIKNDDIIHQNFVSSKKYNGIGFKFATYSEILNNGVIKINIYSKEKKICSDKVKANTIRDNNFYYISCNLKPKKEYTLEIFANDIDKNITLYTTEAKINNASLKLNNELTSKNLLLQFTYNKSNYFKLWYCLLLMLLLSLFLIYENGRGNKK